MVIDRLRSGAGALSDWLDRTVLGGSTRRLGSLLAIGALLVLGVGAGLAWLEATDNPTPRTLTAAEAVSTEDLGRRTYAEVSGSYWTVSVETYRDDNKNGAHDPDETGLQWTYVLASGDPPTGLLVRSDRPPEEVLVRSFSGTLVRDTQGIAEVSAEFKDAGGIHIEPDLYLDATVAVSESAPFDPGSDGGPGDGDAAAVTGSITAGAVWICPTEADCAVTEAAGFIYLVYDPTDDQGVLVYSEEPPSAIVEATVTGMIRSDAVRVTEMHRTEEGSFDPGAGGIIVSEERFLDATARPASAPLVGIGAILTLVLAAVVALGRASGPLVYRREALVPTASSDHVLEGQIETHVTGVLTRAGQSLRVREAPAVIKHVALGPPEGSAGSTLERSTDGTPPGGSAEAVPRGLAIEMDESTGVLVGKGFVRTLSAGTARLLRGPRPAMRLSTTTGKLVLTFDDVRARDRARAVLVAEAGLVVGSTGVARDPAIGPARRS